MFSIPGDQSAEPITYQVHAGFLKIAQVRIQTWTRRRLTQDRQWVALINLCIALFPRRSLLMTTMVFHKSEIAAERLTLVGLVIAGHSLGAGVGGVSGMQ